MTDLAFIVDSSDVALASGRTAAPASGELTGAGSFAGVLSERLHSGGMRTPQSANATSKLPATDGHMVSEGGSGEPVDGKPLPLLSTEQEASPQDSSLASQANTALLAAVSQSAVQNPLGAAATITLDSSLAGSALDSELSNSLTPIAGLFSNAGVNTPAVRADAQPVQPTHTGMSESPHSSATLAQQVMSAKLSELAMQKQQDARPDSNRANLANITPSLLSQPVSESAQRALVLAMNDAGLNKGVAPSLAGQTEAAQTLSARQSGVSLLPNGMSSMMPLAAVTNSAASNDTNAIAHRLAQQTNSTLTSVTSLTSIGHTDEVSGFLSAGTRLNSTAGSGFMPTLPVSTPVGQAGWANELGQRVSWLAQGELREAQLQLHPRSLGPIEVRIAYGHEQQLNVSFTAANPLAREALDAALPRLREMFEQQGLNLADANISQQSFSDQRDQERGEDDADTNSASWLSDADELTEQSMLSSSVFVADGMLDAYA